MRQRKNLISVRVKNEVSQLLDYYTPMSRRKTRTDVVCRLLETFLTCAAQEEIKKVLESNDPYCEGLAVRIVQIVFNK